jgi:hypothetical protein
MRLSASRIRSINHTLASINGRSFYNNDKPLPPSIPDHSYTAVKYVPPALV